MLGSDSFSVPCFFWKSSILAVKLAKRAINHAYKKNCGVMEKLCSDLQSIEFFLRAAVVVLFHYRQIEAV